MCAKSLLLGLTLCDPMDCSPRGSFVHGDSPGKNTGVGCHALLQGIFPTQGLNAGLLHCRQILHCLSHTWRRDTAYKPCCDIFASISLKPSQLVPRCFSSTSSPSQTCLGFHSDSFCSPFYISLIAQLTKNLPAIQETPVRFLGQEDPLLKG